MRKFPVVAACLVWAMFAAPSRASAQSGLQITYGAQGIQRLAYGGTVLEDVSQHPSDAFHIWHMKLTDLNGNPATCNQCGWGENNNGRSWDAGTQTWTYAFAWGRISVNFQQVGDTLNMNVTETNLPNSGYILDGASIFPFVLNFPALPAGFNDASYSQYAFETTAPGVTTADWGSGEVVAVVPDSSKLLYSGFKPAGAANAYTPIISSTSPDGIATFQPHYDRPVLPGQTDSFTVSLRFAPSQTPTNTLALDAYQNWANTWPAKLVWDDRRVIGTAYLASSPSGDPTRSGGFPNNPRRYFNDGNPTDFDVTTPEGLAKFQARVLGQATEIVTNLTALNAQGVVTWDIEGEQFPQTTSYVCSPDQIAQVAPEMESTVSDTNSAFYGIKLDDAYFKIITNAGFRVGVCVRPQRFTLNGDGTAQQIDLPVSSVGAELLKKMQYAHERWGATLFYVDSNVEANGAVLDAAIFQQLAAALPDSLIIPEHSTPKYYAYTAPFLTFIYHGDLGTDPTIYNYYPRAFSTILINDVLASTLAANVGALTTSVQHGDILMGHAGYAQANNATIEQIYQAAGAPQTPPPGPAPPSSPPTPPVSGDPVPPAIPAVITSPADSASVSGVVAVTAQINVSLGLGGSYLTVDGTPLGSVAVSQPPYMYSLDTTTLNDGAHTLQVWAHDTTEKLAMSQPITISVLNSPAPPPAPIADPQPAVPAPSNGALITSPAEGATLSGTIAVSGRIGAALDSAGSYLMVDGIQFGTTRVSTPPYLYSLDTTLLPNGTHALQIWSHNTSNEVGLSPVVSVTTLN